MGGGKGRAKGEGGRAVGGMGEKLEKGGKFEIVKNLARPLQRPVHVACFRPQSVTRSAACLPMLLSKSTRQGSILRHGELQ